MPTKEVKALKRELKEKKAEWKNLETAWRYLSWGWRIIFVIGIITTIWIILKLMQFLRILFLNN